MLNGIEWAGVWYSGIGQTVPRTGWTVESRIALGYGRDSIGWSHVSYMVKWDRMDGGIRAALWYGGIPLDSPTYSTWYSGIGWPVECRVMGGIPSDSPIYPT